MHRADRRVTPAPLIDTHCHLVLLRERDLLQQALDGARRSGVVRMVTIGVSLPDSDANREIAEANDDVRFAVGWDPQQPSEPGPADCRALADLMTHPKVVAVGEVGLDYKFRPGYHETPAEVQQRSFRRMLELARDHDLPVVVHDREAHDDVLRVISEVPGSRGVMHCFSGDAVHATRCVEAGFLVSFSGIVTFRNAAAVQDAARSVAAGCYVVETDAPFLAPVPHRGTINMPARVRDTARHIAALRGVDEQTVCAETTAAAQSLFRFSVDEP
jgi:TatD DNase family protein